MATPTAELSATNEDRRVTKRGASAPGTAPARHGPQRRARPPQNRVEAAVLLRAPHGCGGRGGRGDRRAQPRRGREKRCAHRLQEVPGTRPRAAPRPYLLPAPRTAPAPRQHAARPSHPQLSRSSGSASPACPFCPTRGAVLRPSSAPPPAPKMAAAGGAPVRLRLQFDFPPPGSPGCALCWLLLEPGQARLVTDLLSIIRHRFGFSRRARLSLFLDGALLPPTESARLVRDNDALRYGGTGGMGGGGAERC